MPRLALVALTTLLFACSPAATPVAPTSATPTAAASSAPTASPTAASATSWVVSERSKATVRVREQLVGLDAPNDAVLVATGATGSFALNADGTFAPDSKITFDLTTLASDSRDRDSFVKQTTLNVRQFPKAELVPTKTSGLTVPLLSSGSFAFQLVGKVTIHGVTKDVTFDVQATRDGEGLTATATANPAWKFADFGMSAPSVPFRVVSVVDEIRLTVELVASGPKT
jgi:polyisoprenoid-binding protein YceI